MAESKTKKDTQEAKATEEQSGKVAEPVATEPATEPVAEQEPTPAPIVIRLQKPITRTNLVTGQKMVHIGVVEETLEAPPVSVTVAHHHAFYDDTGALRGWMEGQVVTDPEQIATLLERGVVLSEYR